MEGREEGRKKGTKEGRKEGRKEGGKKGRKGKERKGKERKGEGVSVELMDDKRTNLSQKVLKQLQYIAMCLQPKFQKKSI